MKISFICEIDRFKYLGSFIQRYEDFLVDVKWLYKIERSVIRELR